MLNQVIMVGRLVRDPEAVETETGKRRCHITVAVVRSYKNIDGEYETDFIDCVLWDGVAQNTAEWCKKGDIIGVKGRLQTTMIENEEGKKKITEVVAEKITFLSSKKSEEKEDE